MIVKNPRKIHDEVRKFILSNLEDLCREKLEWSNTGILPSGKFREAASMLTYSDFHQLRIVDDILYHCVLEKIVRESKNVP